MSDEILQYTGGFRLHKAIKGERNSLNSHNENGNIVNVNIFTI